MSKGKLVVLFVLAILLVSYFGWKLIDTIIFVSKAKTVSGQVVGLGGGTNGFKIIITPAIKFKDASGYIINTNSEVVQFGLFSNNINDQVDIFYDPENSQHARINNFITLWLQGLVMLFGGILLLIISFLKFLKLSK